MPEFIYNGTDKARTFRVTLTQTGPRGGKRPPLIDAQVRADTYDEAHQVVWDKFYNRLTHTVET